MTRPRRTDAYCAFRNDQERRRALVSRDVRLVLIAIAGVVASAQAAPHAWGWLLQLLHGGVA